VHKGFCWRDLRKTDHLEDLGLDSKIILERIRKKWYEGAWTELAQDRERWRELVNAVMNLPWSQKSCYERGRKLGGAATKQITSASGVW